MNRFWDLCVNQLLLDETMHSYGWYHLMWLAIMVIAIVIFSLIFARKHDKKTDNVFVFSCGIIFVLIEGFKQMWITVDGGGYNVWYFPYQFCSVPMYLAVIAPLLKEGKVKEAMFKFLAIVNLAAGLSVMLYPESCLNTTSICLLIHTMLWHTTMVVLGIYLVISKDYMKNIKNFFSEAWPASLMLYAMIFIAMVSNFILYPLGVEVNFFYISPYFETTFPILDIIQEKAPYVVFLLMYVLSFTTAICIVWFAAFGIRKLFKKKSK